MPQHVTNIYRLRSEASEGYVFTGICLFNFGRPVLGGRWGVCLGREVGGGGLPWEEGRPPEGQTPPVGQTPLPQEGRTPVPRKAGPQKSRPPREGRPQEENHGIWSVSKQYASFWNAFLFKTFFYSTLKFFKIFTYCIKGNRKLSFENAPIFEKESDKNYIHLNGNFAIITSRSRVVLIKRDSITFSIPLIFY